MHVLITVPGKQRDKEQSDKLIKEKHKPLSSHVDDAASLQGGISLHILPLSPSLSHSYKLTLGGTEIAEEIYQCYR